MLANSTLLLLCIPPGPASAEFITTNKAALSGKGLVDMTASWTRFYGPESRPPSPYESHVSWLKVGSDVMDVVWRGMVWRGVMLCVCV